jgi:hypothetical protein
MDDMFTSIDIENENYNIHIEGLSQEDIASIINMAALESKDNISYEVSEGVIPGFHYIEFVLFDVIAMGYSPEFGIQLLWLT